MRNEPTNSSNEKSRLRSQAHNLESGFKEIKLLIDNYLDDRDFGLYASDREVIEKIYEISQKKLDGDI